MRLGFAKQYETECVILETEDEGKLTFEEVSVFAYENGCMYYGDPVEEMFVVQFPKRPKELYTGEALKRSLKR